MRRFIAFFISLFLLFIVACDKHPTQPKGYYNLYIINQTENRYAIYITDSPQMIIEKGEEIELEKREEYKTKFTVYLHQTPDSDYVFLTQTTINTTGFKWLLLSREEIAGEMCTYFLFVRDSIGATNPFYDFSILNWSDVHILVTLMGVDEWYVEPYKDTETFIIEEDINSTFRVSGKSYSTKWIEVFQTTVNTFGVYSLYLTLPDDISIIYD